MKGLAGLPAVQRLIELAIEEDLGRGDATTAAVLGGDDREVDARLVARQVLVLAGVDVAAAVFARVDPEIEIDVQHKDGELLAAGAVVMTVSGPAATILQAERTALNFLQRLSGVATQARRFADAVVGTGARVIADGVQTDAARDL
ncbi:MAG TPA: nicotinate-nucleotide diphosphorylase (carboxylating), partial [Kofleriaceae bacterium]|nr:nicotinate-nucleotide diphosphorylase (carboxylating) [Kofleriaceae bacterium]